MLDTRISFQPVRLPLQQSSKSLGAVYFGKHEPSAPQKTGSPFLKGLLWSGALLASFIAGNQTRPWLNPPVPSKQVQPVASPVAEPIPHNTPKLLEGHPPIEPFRTRMLQVSPTHRVYIEESGNPKGYPVFYLHGGPGAGLGPGHRQFFDPQFFHIIGFDQRGCGKSTPYGELQENNTQALIQDIETIRNELGIKGKALIWGGSWGSLLALAYAQAHPEHVSGLILRGISLGDPVQTSWSSHPTNGVSNLLPESGYILGRPLEGIPLSEEDIKLGRDPYLGIYYRLFTDPSVPEQKRLEAVRDWGWAESMLSGYTLAELEAENKPLEAYREDLPMTRLICHYYYHNAFLDHPDQLLKNVDKLKDIKHITIVNGRDDFHTPPIRAFLLHQALTKAGIPSTLKIVEKAGHSAWQQPVTHELLTALNRFRAMVEAEPTEK